MCLIVYKTMKLLDSLNCEIAEVRNCLIAKFKIETVLENTLQPIQPHPGLVDGDFDFPELHSGLCILNPSGSKN